MSVSHIGRAPSSLQQVLVRRLTKELTSKRDDRMCQYDTMGLEPSVELSLLVATGSEPS